jgi:hypothetical protein
MTSWRVEDGSGCEASRERGLRRAEEEEEEREWVGERLRELEVEEEDLDRVPDRRERGDRGERGDCEAEYIGLLERWRGRVGV